MSPGRGKDQESAPPTQPSASKAFEDQVSDDLAAQPPRTTGYNDIDLARWREYQSVETDSLWLIPARDRSDGHKLDYHGSFVPQIATQTFLRYSRRGDVVLDLFCGSGTSAIEAVRLDRRFIGVELKPDLVEQVRDKLPEAHLDHTVFVIQGDSSDRESLRQVRSVLASIGRAYAQLLVLHPPYHDIIAFSDLPQDLSNAPSVEDFLAGFEAVARNGYELLEPGRFAVLVIGDKYADGQLVPLGFWCMQSMNQVGFLTKALVVKNIVGNEKGKGRTNSLWRYRALAGGFYVFKHEYVIIFRKPGPRAGSRSVQGLK